MVTGGGGAFVDRYVSLLISISVSMYLYFLFKKTAWFYCSFVLVYLYHCTHIKLYFFNPALPPYL